MSADFILRETGANLRRHSLAALASVTTTALCLMILGGFVLAVMMVQKFASGLLDNSAVVAYVNPSVSPRDARELRRNLLHIPGVKDATLVDKATAWAEEKAKYNNIPELDAMDNPLGDELRVSLRDMGKSREIVKAIGALKGVDKVGEGGMVVDRLVLINRILKTVGLVLSGVLLLATVFIIGNAIRLGVFSRRREIKIMKLVGATDGFIRMPFLLEGMVHGLFGAALAVLALSVGARAFTEIVTHSLPFLPVSAQGLRLEALYVVLFVTGGFLGLSGSYLSVRRFLRTSE